MAVRSRGVQLRGCGGMAALEQGPKIGENLLLHLSRLSKHLAACSDMEGPSRGLGRLSSYLEYCGRCLGPPGHPGPHSPAGKAVGGQLMESGLQGCHHCPVIAQQGHLKASKK